MGIAPERGETAFPHFDFLTTEKERSSHEIQDVTDAVTKRKVAVNITKVVDIVQQGDGTTDIWFTTKGMILNVAEDFDTVFSRLNTLAE